MSVKVLFQMLAYNSQDYIRKTIESVIAQTDKSWILYVIDNGSTDDTGKICEEYAKKDGRIIEGVSLGDGPIDAAFLAIERIVGRHYELDDFQIQSITQGREAVGSALVKLREGGQLYSGNGISTDIIGASIRAYVNALNKIAYEE